MKNKKKNKSKDNISERNSPNDDKSSKSSVSSV